MESAGSVFLLAILPYFIGVKVFFNDTMSYTWFLTVPLAIGLLKVLELLYHQFTYWRGKTVPYVGTAPIFGSGWRALFRRMGFVDYCQNLYDFHPGAKYIGFMDFSTPTIMLRDPELIKEVALKNFEHFTDHRGFINEEMDPVFGKNVFSLKGDRWRDMRQALTPSFTANKMRFMFQLVSKCSRDFVEYMKNHPEVASCWEAKDVFSRYANDVIATVAFGLKVNSLEHQNNEFYIRGKDMTSFSGVRKLIKFILFRISPRLMRSLGVTFFGKSTMRFFMNIITETVKVREEKGIERPDMIQLMMQAREKEGSYEKTIEDIVAQSFIFFLAGFDTISTSLSFIIYELAANQDVQEKLREEVDRTVAKGQGEITYEDLATMEYMDMVISESLRKHPALFAIDRVCVKSFEMPPCMPGAKPYLMTPGTQIWFPLHAMHSDPKFFPDPEKFDPERFSEDNKDKIVPCSYMPFGLGPRKCIGNRFALMETKIVIAHLLQSFRLKLSEKTIQPVTLNKKLFIPQIDGGVWIKLEKRDPPQVELSH